jgi:hypothetical protein
MSSVGLTVNIGVYGRRTTTATTSSSHVPEHVTPDGYERTVGF